MATPDAEFAAHCVELLQPLGAARAKRMFGGHGLYLEGLMIGLISGEQLYLKTDAQTVAHRQEAGGRPFVYRTRRQGEVRTATMSYWTPPAEAIESPALMRPWARLALEAALRAQAARQTRAPAASRRREPATSRQAKTLRPRKP
jgi:DNA transformation protein and related proteins